jgi:hypothetical protein
LNRPKKLNSLDASMARKVLSRLTVSIDDGFEMDTD